MSGGSMDYLCDKVYGADFVETTPNRTRFRGLLIRVAKALHDIEWVDSGDFRSGDEDEAINACFDFIRDAEIEKAAATKGKAIR